MYLISLLSMPSSWSFPIGVSVKRNTEECRQARVQQKSRFPPETDRVCERVQGSPTCRVEELIHHVDDAVRGHDVGLLGFQFVHQKCVVHL